MSLIGFAPTSSVIIYYLPDDIGEEKNLIGQNPAKADELRSLAMKARTESEIGFAPTSSVIVGRKSQKVVTLSTVRLSFILSGH